MTMIFIIALIGFLFLSTLQKSKSSDVKKLKVTASFYPLAFLAQTIGGEQVTVTNLTPSGAEPHEFEPSTRDIVKLTGEDIILLNGGGIEGYGEKIKANINSQKTEVAIIGEPFMSNSQDPHIWLDPVLYKKEAEAVSRIFVRKDPSHTSFYEANLKRLVRDLELLHTEYTVGLRNCDRTTIITSHKAFEYLAKRYKLQEVALSGLSPEQEPSAKTISDITTFAKSQRINYIFFEELMSPRIAETIAHEIGAKTLVFNPLEGLTKEDTIRGRTYLSIQKENLKNLQIALSCK